MSNDLTDRIEIEFSYNPQTGLGEIQNFPGNHNPKIQAYEIQSLSPDHHLYFLFNKPYYLPITSVSTHWILHARPDSYFHDFFLARADSIKFHKGENGILGATGSLCQFDVTYLHLNTREIIHVILLVVRDLHTMGKSLDLLETDNLVMYKGAVCFQKVRFVARDPQKNDYQMVADFIKSKLLEPETPAVQYPAELKNLLAALEQPPFVDGFDSFLVDHLAILCPARKTRFFQGINSAVHLATSEKAAYDKACSNWRLGVGNWITSFQPWNRDKHFKVVLSTMAYPLPYSQATPFRYIKGRASKAAVVDRNGVVLKAAVPYRRPSGYDGYSKASFLKCSRNAGIHLFDGLTTADWTHINSQPEPPTLQRDIMLTHSFGKVMLNFQEELARQNRGLLSLLIDGSRN